jgi:hypothetical protein
LSSLRILALSFRVERGIPYSSERLLRSDVIELLCFTMLDKIKIWLSFRVLKMSLRRSAIPLLDIGADAHPSPAQMNYDITF